MAEEPLYNIISTGEIALHADKPTVVAQLAALFKISEDKAERLISKRTTLKKSVVHGKAMVYRSKLEDIGTKRNKLREFG